MNTFLATFAALFSVVNPLGAMPVFIALTNSDAPEWRLIQLRKAAIFLCSILFVSLVVGSPILKFFGLSINALRVAGGIIIMGSGFDLLSTSGSKEKQLNEKSEREAIEKSDISLTPLAMPLLSGPGSISYMIGKGTEIQNNWDYLFCVLAILATGVATYIILRVAPRLVGYLGQSGITSLTRIMGFITLSLGVQFIVNGSIPLLQDMFEAALKASHHR